VNDHPESVPPAGDEPEPVPFEDIVAGLEDLGADVEREAKAAEQKAARERGEQARAGGQEGGREPSSGDAADNPLAGLLGMLGMAGGAVLIFFAVAMTARFAVPILARIVGAPLTWRASGSLPIVSH